MSKLPKAPLLEVVYELRWKVAKQSDLAKYQYLPGDLYALLKNTYPHREPLVQIEVPIDVLVNTPVHRFRVEKNRYPLFQVGPGVLTFNTIDSEYFSEDYYQRCNVLTKRFFEVYPHDIEDRFYPNLIYFDFFKLDSQKDDVIKFINENFNLTIAQSFYSTTVSVNNFNFNFTYPTELGTLSVILSPGVNNLKQETGLLLQTQLSGPEYGSNYSLISQWLDKAHGFCSQLFKNIIKPELYETFKS